MGVLMELLGAIVLVGGFLYGAVAFASTFRGDDKEEK